MWCCALLANRDPLAKILGDRFATISGADDSAYRFIEDVMRSSAPPTARSTAEDGAESSRGQDDDVDKKKLELKLLLLLKDFDDKLLQEAIKTISTLVLLLLYHQLCDVG